MRMCGLGDNVVDRYVAPGLTYPGGNAVNVAVHARRSGAEAAYVGVIGADDAGDLIESSLRTEGVDISRMRRVAGETAFATVFTDAVGNRSFGYCDKGVSLFEPDVADFDYLEGFDVVHVCETGGLEAALPRIASRAKISYDFSDRPSDYAEPLLQYATIATFSRPDSSDADVIDTIAWAHSHGADFIIVTRGALGAVVSTKAMVHHQPAIPAQVVDTLGAGDAFISRLVVRLWDGVSLPAAAADAAAYSADVCCVAGGFGYGRTMLAHPTQPIKRNGMP